MNLNQIATTVKEILLDYPSDYDSKSIEKADRRRFKVTKCTRADQLRIVSLILSWAHYISNLSHNIV